MCVNGPKHLDEDVPGQMQDTPARRDVDVRDGLRLTRRSTHFAVASERVLGCPGGVMELEYGMSNLQFRKTWTKHTIKFNHRINHRILQRSPCFAFDEAARLSNREHNTTGAFFV